MFKLRYVEPQDWALLYAWRSDPQTFKWFLTPVPPTLEEHKAWFAMMLKDKQGKFWMCTGLDGSHVGTMAAHREHAGVIDISITIAPKHRGHGISAFMLGEARELLRNSKWGAAGSVMRAQIHDQNFASLCAFTAAGYELVGRGEHGFVILEQPIS